MGSREGYLPVCPALQTLCAAVAEADLRRGEGPDLQAGQEGTDSLPDWCHPQGQPRCCPGEIHHRQQDPAYPEGQGHGPSVARGCVLPDQEGFSIRKHLERNRKDKDAKFRLILVESRIHRLARYYKTKGVLPPTFKYESSTASTLVS